MLLSLHLLYESLKGIMYVVDLARQIGEVCMQIDFCTGDPAMTPIAAHIEKIHTTTFQFR
jgi:hypothetical protein